MDEAKRKALEKAGWVFEDAAEFLELTEEERRLVELRLAVARAVRGARLARKLTQGQAARALNTSRPDVSKIETADRHVSLDLMFRSLFALGGVVSDILRPVHAGSDSTPLTVE